MNNSLGPWLIILCCEVSFYILYYELYFVLSMASHILFCNLYVYCDFIYSAVIFLYNHHRLGLGIWQLISSVFRGWVNWRFYISNFHTKYIYYQKYQLLYWILKSSPASHFIIDNVYNTINNPETPHYKNSIIENIL